MPSRAVGAAAFFLALAAPPVGTVVSAQVATPRLSAPTPAECTKAVAAWHTAQVAPALEAYRAATDSNRAELMTRYSAANTAANAGGQKVAADCAAGFDLATIADVHLADLIALYNLARDTSKTRLATERLLNGKNLSPVAKAQSLSLAMGNEISAAAGYFGIIQGAENYLKQIDALAASENDPAIETISLAAHQRMLGQYEYLDVADGLQQHALAIIALGRKLDKPTVLTGAYSSLARSYADRLMPDSALRILDNAEKELGEAATAAFKSFRDRYALIGTPAAAIPADWWINTDAKTIVTPARGKVTLIEFTAHWCGPCKNSYPGLKEVAERFKGKDFAGVMVTSLYGYLGTKQGLTPEQEVEADKIYFGTDHAVPFPVAINAPPKNEKGVRTGVPKPDTDYRVGGIPQIIIVDKNGIIRQIVIGWDHGNTERFTKMIEALLKEKIS